MNSFWGIIGLIGVGTGYAVGWQHGADVARHEAHDLAPKSVVVDYPYASACSEMLEAAWAVEGGASPREMPHNP